MTISSISPMASPANVNAASMKRHGQSDTALRFGHRFGSFSSIDSDDSFDLPSTYASKPSANADSFSDSEEKAAVPSSRTSQADTASLNSQGTRKRDKVWSFLSGKREAQPSPATAFSVPRSGGSRRWSLPEQPSAQKESKRKRFGNWLLTPFRSKEKSLPPAPPTTMDWLRYCEQMPGVESSLSMALSSVRGDIETPPTSNDRRTSL